MNKENAEIRSKIDYIYSAVIADNDALEDAQMTLEVIKKTDPGVYDGIINDSLSLIRFALSHPILGAVDELTNSNQKPVAWMHTTAVGGVYFRKNPQDAVFNPQPVYTAPPQRKRLTDEEIEEIAEKHVTNCYFDTITFARAIEAAYNIGE